MYPGVFGLEKLAKSNLYEFRLNYSVPKVVPKCNIMELYIYKTLIIKGFYKLSGGGTGIRTLDRLQTYAGFQDRCIQPLCHPSVANFT